MLYVSSKNALVNIFFILRREIALSKNGSFNKSCTFERFELSNSRHLLTKDLNSGDQYLG